MGVRSSIKKKVSCCFQKNVVLSLYHENIFITRHCSLHSYIYYILHLFHWYTLFFFFYFFFGKKHRFEKRILTPLPDHEGRYQLLKKCLDGELDINVRECDLREMSNLAVNYSSSDMATMAREALMSPVRKCLHATHFRKCSGGGGGSGSGGGGWVPCQSTERGATKINIWR